MITISCINGHQQETKPNLTLHILHTTLFILEIDNNYDIRICKMHKWKFRIMWTAYIWKHVKTKTVGIYARLADEPDDDRVWKSNWGRVVAAQSSTHSYIKIFTYQDNHLQRYSHFKIFTYQDSWILRYSLIKIFTYQDILYPMSRYSHIKISYPIS